MSTDSRSRFLSYASPPPLTPPSQGGEKRSVQRAALPSRVARMRCSETTRHRSQGPRHTNFGNGVSLVLALALFTVSSTHARAQTPEPAAPASSLLPGRKKGLSIQAASRFTM